MDDTDTAGVIYFGCVFRWQESIVAEWLDSVGHPMRSLLAEGVAFPCVHSEADYTYPLRVDDILELRLRAGRVGRTSFQLVSDAWLSAQRAVTIRATYVWARMPSAAAAFGPIELPDWLRRALAEGPGRREGSAISRPGAR